MSYLQRIRVEEILQTAGGMERTKAEALAVRLAEVIGDEPKPRREEPAPLFYMEGADQAALNG